MSGLKSMLSRARKSVANEVDHRAQLRIGLVIGRGPIALRCNAHTCCADSPNMKNSRPRRRCRFHGWRRPACLCSTPRSCRTSNAVPEASLPAMEMLLRKIRSGIDLLAIGHVEVGRKTTLMRSRTCGSRCHDVATAVTSLMMSLAS